MEQQEVNMENINKEIFELSTLIQQFNEKVFEQENVSILINQNAEESVANVEDANKQLTEAREY